MAMQRSGNGCCGNGINGNGGNGNGNNGNGNLRPTQKIISTAYRGLNPLPQGEVGTR